MEKHLNQHLEPLRPFVGKTWRGEFADSTPDKPKVDVSKWEAALGGNAVRILHSVNDGEYGGETMIVWDDSEQSLVYFYFTNSGFYTRGSMTVDDGHYVTRETVVGSAGGVTDVKSTSHITPDGRMRITSQYFSNGTWVEGQEIMYHHDDGAHVILD